MSSGAGFRKGEVHSAGRSAARTGFREFGPDSPPMAGLSLRLLRPGVVEVGERERDHPENQNRPDPIEGVEFREIDQQDLHRREAGHGEPRDSYRFLDETEAGKDEAGGEEDPPGESPAASAAGLPGPSVA